MGVDYMARYKPQHRKKLRFKKMNFVLLFSIIYSIIILYNVISIDILPTKYVIAAVSAYTIINLVFFLLINVKKKLLRAIFLIFLVLFCDINIIGNYYIDKTFSFLKTSFGSTKSDPDAPTEAYNIFLSGHDFDNFRDFNMILTVNVTKHQVLMTSIPRDYYIEQVGKGYKNKLSFIRDGIDVSQASVEKLFDIKVDYYVDVNTNSIVKLVDTIGGIEFCSDYEYYTTHAQVLDTYDDSTGSKLYVTKGCKYYNGIQILTISRERLKLPGGDRARQENIQKILISTFKKMASPEIITKFDSVLDAVDGMYETTVPMEAVTAIIKDTMAHGNNWKFDQQSVDGSDTHASVDGGANYDWVMMPNYDTVEKAKQKINEALK